MVRPASPAFSLLGQTSLLFSPHLLSPVAFSTCHLLQRRDRGGNALQITGQQGQLGIRVLFCKELHVPQSKAISFPRPFGCSPAALCSVLCLL